MKFGWAKQNIPLFKKKIIALSTENYFRFLINDLRFVL